MSATLLLKVQGIRAGGYNISHCLDGDRVELVAEPNNEFDPHAIRVDAMTGETLGYLPADYAAVMDAREWSASISAVVLHPATGAPAGATAGAQAAGGVSIDTTGGEGGADGGPRKLRVYLRSR